MDTDNLVYMYMYMYMLCSQLRARRVLLQLKDVLLRTRRALLLCKVNGNYIQYRPSGSQRNMFDLQYSTLLALS